MSTCSFCSEINNEPDNNLFLSLLKPKYEMESRMLFFADNWIVMPTIGALVAGHLLIVSKEHYESVGKAPLQDYHELNALANAIEQVLEKAFNANVIAFEHGAVSSHKRGGCCVEHAHLHILPWKEELIGYIMEKQFTINRINSFIQLKECVLLNKAYFFYQNLQGEKFLITGDVLPSQFFRKLIAVRLGMEDKWDWRKEIFLDNIAKTLEQIDTNLLGKLYEEYLLKEGLGN